jgi:catechol 2,3-dioxygenase-like lactoylglutathione lyase family enzyme
MSIALNHTIIPARDKRASAAFLAGILGLPDPTPYGPFMVLSIPNGVSLDYLDGGDSFDQHHYAFLVDESEFDPIFERLQAAGTKFYADPHRTRPGEINHHDGGRGVYFDDPDDHVMEVITRPYGAQDG